MDIDIALLILFVVGYGVFKTLEAAFGEVSINKIKFAAEIGDEKATVLNKYFKKIKKLETTIQLSYIICFVLAGYFAVAFFQKKLYPTISSNNYIPIFGVMYTTMFVIIMFLFGNVMASKVGIKYGENFILFTRKPMTLISFVLSPVVLFSMYFGHLMGKAIDVNICEDEDGITEEEIRSLVDAGEDIGAIDESEKEMINNIFEFNNTIVGDVATHRTDIVAVPLTASLDDIIAVISEEKFSRIPVYDENIDDIIGFFRVRDLLKFYINGSNGENFHFNDIIHEPYFVPFSKKTDELFEDMQKNKVQMAIIIDEYGGTAGIVTMEDLIEEIVGNIFDEYDIDEEEIREIDENTYLVKGTTELEDVEDALDIEFEDGEDYGTIGGFVIGQLGRIPDEDERPKIVVNNIILKVEKIDDKRIELIKIHKIIESTAAAQ